jgi:hypothetical protein
MILFADIAGSWTVLVTTPAGETVAAGNWPHLIEAQEWARGVNRSRRARIRAVVPLVLARDVATTFEEGQWR